MLFMIFSLGHPRAKKLNRLSRILGCIPTITDMLCQDLADGVKNRPAEQKA